MNERHDVSNKISSSANLETARLRDTSVQPDSNDKTVGRQRNSIRSGPKDKESTAYISIGGEKGKSRPRDEHRSNRQVAKLVKLRELKRTVRRSVRRRFNAAGSMAERPSLREDPETGDANTTCGARSGDRVRPGKGKNC